MKEVVVRKADKTAQFYLVAAIIIAAIIISVVAVSNYSKKSEFKDIESLKEEIQIESAKTIDYGTNNKLSQTQMNLLLQDFTQRYIDTESGDKNLYFVFGNQGNMTLRGYQGTAHSVSLDGTQVTSSSGGFLGTVVPTAASITMGIDNNAYIFTLKAGENFFFVISRETGGESHVVTG
ncbi:MAG: hypothetical protein AABX79_00625 [Nanoarchaeota archaeon]